MESFKKDLGRKELLPVKILMFLIYGGQATLYPYFTVHLKSLGVSIKQTAIIFAVQPVIALIVAPMIGMAADKIGNFKLIFSFFLIFSAVTANLLLLVPPVTKGENSFYLDLHCDSKTNAYLKLNKERSCQFKPSAVDTFINTSVIFQCKSECKRNSSINIPLILVKSRTNCQDVCYDKNETGCSLIRQDSSLNIHLRLTNNSMENEISLLDYNFSFKNEIYDGLSCICFPDCENNCTFVGPKSFEECFSHNDEDFGVTFWSYLGTRLTITLGIGLVNGLFDAASMTIIQDLKADVGYQRFWSTVAMCVLAPISGFLVDEFDSFKPCFFMYGILYTIAALTSLKLDLSMKLPSENPLRNLALLLQNPEVIFLLIQIAALGICWGFLENFLFWFLESELHSNNLIMGLTVTVGSGTGLFMALVATWTTKKIGYVNVIIVAFAAYTVRFLGYSVAQSAYFCLIFEMMENFTVTLLTVGVTLYCTELASIGMLTTIMTLWNGLHVISGRAFGSLLGGFLVQTYGFRQTFRYFAYGSAGFGVFYSLMYITWLRRWHLDHRKSLSDSSDRKVSLSEEEEEVAMKNQAFSSFSFHCSLDSPGFIPYVPEHENSEFRRRALSHAPLQIENSFNTSDINTRLTKSFSGGNRPSLDKAGAINTAFTKDNHLAVGLASINAPLTDLKTKL